MTEVDIETRSKMTLKIWVITCWQYNKKTCFRSPSFICSLLASNYQFSTPQWPHAIKRSKQNLKHKGWTLNVKDKLCIPSNATQSTSLLRCCLGLTFSARSVPSVDITTLGTEETLAVVALKINISSFLSPPFSFQPADSKLIGCLGTFEGDQCFGKPCKDSA